MLFIILKRTAGTKRGRLKKICVIAKEYVFKLKSFLNNYERTAFPSVIPHDPLCRRRRTGRKNRHLLSKNRPNPCIGSRRNRRNAEFTQCTSFSHHNSNLSA